MPPHEPPPAGNEASPKDSVLLIDDEQPMLDIYLSALSPRFEVETASSAREADELVRRKRFKVVVADNLMPGETGLSFLIRMREAAPHMQRVLVTGYMKPDVLLRCVSDAALFRYLSKPVAMSELVKVIEAGMREHDVSLEAGGARSPSGP